MRCTNFLLPLLATLLVFVDCRKPAVDTNDTYLNCKINGEDYNPAHCPNCLAVEISQDSLLLFSTHNGAKTLGIGINHPPKLITQSYQLTGDLFQNGEYQNSGATDDYYRTISNKPGKFTIERLDTINTLIKASFSFVAYHSFRANDSVVVTGNFNLKYHNC